MDARRFRGLGPAVVTPMHADGSVDLEGFAAHAEFLVTGGADFLVPCGTTGESATLDAAEQLFVVERAVEAAGGRVPVMAGAGTNDTREAAQRARAAAGAGADAILSVTPYYNKPTQEGLRRHYLTVADAAGIPVFVYNVPGRTGCNILPETIFRLAERHEMIVGVKEASGDLDQVMTILRDRPEDLVVLSGEDHMTFPMIALGAEGVISVVANEVPSLVAEMVHAALDGDHVLAREIHYRLLPLMRANFVETNPIPVKAALEIMGHRPAHFRLPLHPPSQETRARLTEALEAAGVELPRDAGRALAAQQAGTGEEGLAARSAP